MNHYLATYIDFIQSIGFISIFALVIFAVTRTIVEKSNDEYIEAVKIKVDE